MGQGISRRNFLQAVGALYGSATAFTLMQGWGFLGASAQAAPPALRGQGQGVKVAILGAGLAGMTAAYELGKLGYDCTILEARPVAGGRCQTARRGTRVTEAGGTDLNCEFDEGIYYNFGPWRIPEHHRSTLYYLRTFGVPVEVFVNENDGAYVYTGQGPLAGKKLRLREVKADLRGYTAELLAKSLKQNLLEAPLSAEDKESLVAYLVSEGHLESEGLAYKGTSARGFKVDPGAGMDPGPGTPGSLYAMSELLQSGHWQFLSSVAEYDMQPTMFQPVGGMDQLAKAFVKQLPGKINYDCEVREIRQGPAGVRVIYQDLNNQPATLEADYVICTIPLSVLARVQANFSPEMSQAIRGVAYDPTVKVGLQMKRRFWEEDEAIYGGHSQTDFMTGAISYPSYGFHQAKGVLQGAYNFGSQAVELSLMPPQERIQYTLAQVKKLHPQAEGEFETGFTVAWHRMPYNLGGWAAYTSESLQNAYPRLNQPDGRIYLAGEHLSYLTGWQAGAIESAWIQIQALHQRALAEGAARG